MQFVANPGILQREVDVIRDTREKELHLIMRVLVPVLTLVESLENEMNLHVILHTRLQSLDAKVESAVQLSWAADCSAKLLDCTSTSRLIAVAVKKGWVSLWMKDYQSYRRVDHTSFGVLQLEKLR